MGCEHASQIQHYVKMKFDDILRRIGEFGRYQKILYFFLSIGDATNGTFMMAIVLFMFTPKHRCKIPGLINDTYAVQNQEHQSLINAYIPPSKDSQHIYELCYIYNEPLLSNSSNISVIECSEWVYDKTVFYETFTSKANLVCGDSLKASHAIMVFHLGVLVGDISFGSLSDYIGRKKVFQITSALLCIASFAVSWAPELYSFCILEFFTGAANHGLSLVCVVLGIEFVGPSKRVYAGVLIHVYFAVALTYQSGIGYLFRHWKYIQLINAAPTVIYFIYFKFIPESPRWLISKGRYKEAEKVIQKAATVNKVILPKGLVDDKTIEIPDKVGLWQLFTHRNLCVRTLIIFYNWAVITMIFYGVTIHIGNLGGDFYLNYFIQSIITIPSFVCPVFFLDKLGRRKFHCLCMLTAGFGCLSVMFPLMFGGPELHSLTITLAMFGKIGSAAAFPVVYTFSLELFPTVVRNGAVGVSSCVARLGSIAAPYIAIGGTMIGGKFGPAFPLLVFGGLSTAAGLLALLLPETRGRKLPDTIAEGECFGTSMTRDEITINPEEADDMVERNGSTTDFSVIEFKNKLEI